jgi:magnesium-transporting ATPase (P-type)
LSLLIKIFIILRNGTVIVNEAMLTGESIPIIKNALPYDNN